MGLLLKLNQRIAQGFSGFWDRWPRKHAKKDATKAWQKLNPDHALEEKIHAALDWQIPIFEQREPQYIPLAATWLRGERWEDEPPKPTMPKTISRTTVVPMALQQMDAASRIRSLVATGMDREEAKRQVYRELGWIKSETV